MSKKIRLVNNFNDAAVLEVEYKPSCWARVTSNHFRSYTGNRRINGDKYNGPVYYEGTNNRYKKIKKDAVRVVLVSELNGKVATKKNTPIVRFYDRDAKYR